MVNGVPSRQVRGYFCNKEEAPTLHPYYIHGHKLIVDMSIYYRRNWSRMLDGSTDGRKSFKIGLVVFIPAVTDSQPPSHLATLP